MDLPDACYSQGPGRAVRWRGGEGGGKGASALKKRMRQREASLCHKARKGVKPEKFTKM